MKQSRKRKPNIPSSYLYVDSNKGDFTETLSTMAATRSWCGMKGKLGHVGEKVEHFYYTECYSSRELLCSKVTIQVNC